MNNKILKKLSERVVMEKFKDGLIPEYRVFKRVKISRFLRMPSYSDWELALITSSIPKAIRTKHNLWMIILRDLGYRIKLTERRRKRKK